MDEAGDRGQGHRAAAARARRDREDHATTQLAVRALGSTLRADVDVAQQHELRHRQPVRPVGRAGPRRSVAATRRSCCRAASGMPDRDYYLDESPRMAAIRDKYAAHIADDADARARRRRRRAGARAIVALETQDRAGATRTRDRVRGRPQGQQPLARAEDLAKRAPGLDWAAFFAAAGLDRAAGVHRLAARRRSRRSPRWSPASRSTRGRTT